MQLNNDIASLSNQTVSAGQIKRNTQLTQDDFMKLLLAQLRLQSPENPFDSSTMMQQISQLTTLSATHEMEESVKSLSANLGSSQVLSAAQLVGKKVQVDSDSSTLVEGAGLSSALVLPSNVEKATVTIRDASDNVVRVLDLGPKNSGMVDFVWDGRDTNNNPMPPGPYKISGTGIVDGDSISVPVTGVFNVSSVSLDKNGKGVLLNLDGLGSVGLDEVIRIM